MIAAPPRKDQAPQDARARADAFLDAHRAALLVLAALLAVGVAVTWVLAKTTGLVPPMTEQGRVAAVAAYQGPVRDVALAIARLGDAGLAVATVALLSAYAFVREGRRAALLPPAAAAVVVLTTVAKHLPGRETTLPSGHAAYAVAVGGCAAWLLLRAGRPGRAAALLALALLMAPARVIEGAHRPADVVAGVALAAAWLLALLVLARPRATT